MKDDKKKDQKPEEEKLGSKIELNQEELDYFHNLLLWEEFSGKTYYVFGRGKCIN
ncbi:MAG: hypothetical protein Q8Q90_00925 [bacterium]|nr:hypothetical protein [bacterium]